MSSNSSNSSSPPTRPAPHIRLNSAQDDLLSNDPSSQQPQVSQPPGSRSLVPQRSMSGKSINGQGALYNASAVQDSAELLLPPAQSKTRRYRDDDTTPSSPIRSPTQSGFSSRRTSWSSERSRDSRNFENPFSDLRAPSRAGSDDNDVNTQTVSEKYNILPSAGLLLFPEDVEKDDYLHNPDPNEKEKRDCDIFSRRGIVNLGALAIMTLGLLTLFIGYPVL